MRCKCTKRLALNEVDLRSREGVSEPLAWIISFPIWWVFIGVCLVVGLWLWSMAVNVMALNQSGQAISVGMDGEGIRRTTLAAGLGGFASDYANAGYSGTQGRAIQAEVNKSIDVSIFPAPPSYTVQGRVIVRREQFYPRPSDGGWE